MSSPLYSGTRTHWAADLLRVHVDSSISAIPQSPAYLRTERRAANKMPWLTKEKKLYPSRGFSTQRGTALPDGQWWGEPCCPSPLPAPAEGRKWLPTPRLSLLASLLGPPATVPFQSSPEQTVVGEKDRLEEKQKSFTHTEVHT